MVTQTETARGERDLKAGEKRAVALLGVPTMALSLSATIVTTYLPVVAKEFVGSTAVIGVVIGIEGLLALWLPLVVGTWSDRLRTPLGGRLPFLLAAAPRGARRARRRSGGARARASRCWAAGCSSAWVAARRSWPPRSSRSLR